ncbi:hypothetical protein HKK52_02970 [Pseudomonas sp. ADAK2]|uniref:hypothetical protein n=1 Tax=Pseudomonas TaxID=286 RepID=UPI001462B007|nr:MULTISPECIES: hypothetical protein [unclassified Pseudomonas]QJI39926.1 hypothetical protein HKK53_02965 [Pseudomonas sp. ADAK7]QJI45685.1 hypothetical protein HKK52_02970 [Pseudomonas sp. ADAK2]
MAEVAAGCIAVELIVDSSLKGLPCFVLSKPLHKLLPMFAEYSVAGVTLLTVVALAAPWLPQA